MSSAAPLQTTVAKSKPWGRSPQVKLLLQRKFACGNELEVAKQYI